MDLSNRAAVVTGGASGIGAALVEQLADAGAQPVVWDVSPDAQVHCDVTDPASIDEAMAATIDLVGVPTLVTNCAGVGDSASLLDAPLELWDRVINVNLRGTWLVFRAAARALIDADESGSLVAFSSISGRLADRGMGPYCTSKAGVDMLVKVAASEWGPHGIRVNAIAPGVTITPMLGGAQHIPGWLDALDWRTPLGGVGDATTVASATLDLHRMDWVTGESVAVDGGLRLHSPIDIYGATHPPEARP